MKNNKQAFTLIELLVVIAIIGILSTMAVVALQGARAKARDAKRITDIRQMQTALELYFNDWNSYPSAVTAGASIGTGSDIYMLTVPTGPTPADGDCVSSAYSYQQLSGGGSYYLQFCLSGNVGSLGSGIKCASPLGIISTSTACF